MCEPVLGVREHWGLSWTDWGHSEKKSLNLWQVKRVSDVEVSAPESQEVCG